MDLRPCAPPAGILTAAPAPAFRPAGADDAAWEGFRAEGGRYYLRRTDPRAGPARWYRLADPAPHDALFAVDCEGARGTFAGASVWAFRFGPRRGARSALLLRRSGARGIPPAEPRHPAG